MYEQYLENPAAVSESWRDFFADYQRDSDVTASTLDKSLPATGRTAETGQLPVVKAGAPAPVAAATPAPAPAPAAPKSTGIAADGTEEVPGEPLRGASARIVTNMEASLAVPTATSFREVP